VDRPRVGSCWPNAAATVICAITVAPPAATRLLSSRMTDAPPRAAAIAAYMPAPPGADDKNVTGKLVH